MGVLNLKEHISAYLRVPSDEFPSRLQNIAPTTLPHEGGEEEYTLTPNKSYKSFSLFSTPQSFKSPVMSFLLLESPL